MTYHRRRSRLHVLRGAAALKNLDIVGSRRLVVCQGLKKDSQPFVQRALPHTFGKSITEDGFGNELARKCCGKGTDGTLNCGVVLSFSGSATDEWIDGWLVGWLDEWGREDSRSLGCRTGGRGIRTR